MAIPQVGNGSGLGYCLLTDPGAAGWTCVGGGALGQSHPLKSCVTPGWFPLSSASSSVKMGMSFHV